MLKKVVLILLVILLFSFTACNNNTAQSQEQTPEESDETMQIGFEWKPQVMENCGSYPTSYYWENGIYVGNDQKLYYTAMLESDDGMNYRNCVMEYDLASGDEEVLGEATQNKLNLYDNKLYYMGADERLVCLDLESREQKIIEGVENGILINGKMYLLAQSQMSADSPVKLYCQDADTAEKTLIADNLYHEFLAYDNDNLYYAVSGDGEYEVYRYDIKAASSESICKVSGYPRTVYNGAVVCEADGKMLLCTQENEKEIAYKDWQTLGVFGNGNMLFFTAIPEEGSSELQLFAICSDDGKTYELGNVPDPIVGMAGSKLYSASTTDIGNFSFMDLENVKVQVNELWINYAFPYVS